MTEGFAIGRNPNLIANPAIIEIQGGFLQLYIPVSNISGKSFIRANPSLAPRASAQKLRSVNVSSQSLFSLSALATGALLMPMLAQAQSPTAKAGASVSAANRSAVFPAPITTDSFAELKENSPFIRTLNINKSLILTGMAQIEENTVATMLDLETRRSYTLFQGEVSEEGWQLVEINGDPSDVETLTAKVKVDGTEVVSIRYEKAPIMKGGTSGVMVSTRIGDGTPGGGKNPHGGPDPRVLTPDQLKDARNAVRNIKAGFGADGYADNATIPPAVVAKASKLSLQQREKINVKMYEYRNKGLGMPERQKIYNGLLDKELKNR